METKTISGSQNESSRIVHLINEKMYRTKEYILSNTGKNCA